MKSRIVGLLACVALSLSGCGPQESKGDERSGPTRAADKEPAPPEARALFPPRQESLLLSGVARALPHSARPAVVIQSWPRLRRWAGIESWPQETRRAASEALVRFSGVDWLDDEALAAAGIDSAKPMAIGWSEGAIYLSVHPASLEKLKETIEKPRQRRVHERLGRAVIRIGALDPAASPATETLADREGFVEAARRLRFGDDVAVYGFGAARHAVLGLSLEEGHVLSQLVIPLEEEVAWREIFKRSLRADSLEAEPSTEHPRLAAIRAVKDAAASVTVEKLGYDGTVTGANGPRKAQLELARSAGILGMLHSGSLARGKKADKLRAERTALEKKLAEAQSDLAARQRDLSDSIRDQLGTAAAFVEVSEESATFSGGVFFAGETGALSRALADWLLVDSAASPQGARVAELEEKIEGIEAKLGRIASNQNFGVFSSGNVLGGLSPDDRTVYGSLLGDEIGEMKGGFGVSVSGAGRGGGGTGWGTIGTGKYGTIGKGGGTGSGYGRGAGGLGVRKAPTVTLGKIEDPAIRRYVRRKIARVRHCYDRALRKESDLAGTLSVTLEGTDQGAVEARVGGVSNKSLTRCVTLALGGRAPKGEAPSVTFSIELEAAK